MQSRNSVIMKPQSLSVISSTIMRSAGTSRHHRGKIKSHLETPCASWYCGIEGFNEGLNQLPIMPKSIGLADGWGKRFQSGSKVILFCKNIYIIYLIMYIYMYKKFKIYIYAYLILIYLIQGGSEVTYPFNLIIKRKL